MATSLELTFDWRNQRFSDAARGLNAFAAHVGRGLERAPELISAELKEYLEGVAEALSNRHSGAYPGGTSANTMSRRSGFMIDSITDSVTVTGQTIATITGSISIPAERAIHENGGVIRPKNSKYLTIPLPAALDSNGIPKKKSARDWENTFVIKSKKGNLLIVQRDGLELVYLYVLKTEVTIPARLGMRTTLDAGQDYLVDRMATAVLDSLRGKK